MGLVEETWGMVHVMAHPAVSELAGKTVRIRDDVKHPCGGSKFEVEDWWDRIAGKSWSRCDGNPVCLRYAFRAGSVGLPPNDEVLYGKVGDEGHLVHISEVEAGGGEEVA